jgi:hypothetical protein
MYENVAIMKWGKLYIEEIRNQGFKILVRENRHSSLHRCAEMYGELR